MNIHRVGHGVTSQSAPNWTKMTVTCRGLLAAFSLMAGCLTGPCLGSAPGFEANSGQRKEDARSTFGGGGECHLSLRNLLLHSRDGLQSAFLERDGLIPSGGDLNDHFDRVVEILKANEEASLGLALERVRQIDSSNWSEETRRLWRRRLERQRRITMGHLDDYRERRQFPKNDYVADRAVPVFFDRAQTACAVGYLMCRSGFREEAEGIAEKNRFVYVDEVTGGPLVDWILTSGLTQEEAALIQPTYTPPVIQYGPLSFQGNHLIECDKATEGELIIPSFIVAGNLNYSVIAIGSSAFVGCTKLERVVIPDSCSSISLQAFKGCTSLREVVLPSGLRWIGDQAFEGCIALTEVILPETLQGLRERVFARCSSLGRVVVPSSLEWPSTPHSCETCVPFATEAFEGCHQLHAFEVMASSGDPKVRSIDGVLYDEAGTTLLAFPPGKGGVYFVPDGVTGIRVDAFHRCDALTELHLPESLQSLQAGIHFSVADDGIHRFSPFPGCRALVGIEVDSANQSYRSIDGVLFTADLKNLLTYPGGRIASEYSIPESVTEIHGCAFTGAQHLVDLRIPQGVGEIGRAAFSECPRLKSAPLPDGVQVIPPELFKDCLALPEVDFGDSVREIGASAFAGCANLTSIDLPSTLEALPESVFAGCASLESVSLPRALTSLAPSAFDDCRALEAFEVDPLNPVFASVDGILFSADGTILIRYPLARQGAYEISSQVSRVEAHAFSGAVGLTAIAFQSGETTLGERAFYGCEGLSEIDLPIAFDHLSPKAGFMNCTGLRRIVLRAGSAIPTSCFAGCVNLESVSLPETIRALRSSAFSGARSLQKIDLRRVRSYWGKHAFEGCVMLQEIAFPSRVSLAWSGVFRGCTSLKKAKIIPGLSNADRIFAGCTGLTEVSFETGELFIPGGAFHGCHNLKRVILPKWLYEVGESAFSDCSSLESVVFSGLARSSPHRIGVFAFGGCESLKKVIFLGNAPIIGREVFEGVHSNFTSYHHSRSTGFTIPTWQGKPAVRIDTHENPLALWLMAHQLPEDEGINRDLNGDGVDLLTAYAFDLDPHEQNGRKLPRPGIEGNSVIVRYHALSPGIRYFPERSEDLIDWVPMSSELVWSASGKLEQASWSMDSRSQYLRVRVSIDPGE